MGLTYDKVSFQRCTEAEYKSLTHKDNDTVYFILDTQKIYLGDKLFSSTENSKELPEVTVAEDGYVLTVVNGEWVAREPSGE